MNYFLKTADPFTQYNAIIYKDHTPLMLCCQMGLLDKIKLLLNNPIVQLNAKGPETGETALHHAVVSGNVEVVKILATREDLVWNAVDKDGKPAHFLAMMAGNMEMLQLLVSYQAAIDWNIKIEGHPLIHANFYWRNEVLTGSRDQPIGALHRMAIFDLLLQTPTLDWSAKNSNGHTLLGMALSQDDVEMMLFLIKKAPGMNYDLELNQLSSFPLFLAHKSINRCLDRLASAQLTHVFSEAVKFLEAAKRDHSRGYLFQYY